MGCPSKGVAEADVAAAVRSGRLVEAPEMEEHDEHGAPFNSMDVRYAQAAE